MCAAVLCPLGRGPACGISELFPEAFVAGISDVHSNLRIPMTAQGVRTVIPFEGEPFKAPASAMFA